MRGRRELRNPERRTRRHKYQSLAGLTATIKGGVQYRCVPLIAELIEPAREILKSSRRSQQRHIFQDDNRRSKRRNVAPEHRNMSIHCVRGVAAACVAEALTGWATQ
jgi:hypothetical protein